MKVAAEAVAATGIPNPRVLEVGCGSGYYSEVFATLLKEGVRYTENAVTRAPGSGLTHHYNGMANFVLNRLGKAMSHIGTAERLMPGGHINWVLKMLTAYVMMSRERWTEAEEAMEQCCVLIPSFAYGYVLKAVICLNQGRNEEAHQHILTAQKLGGELPSGLWFDTMLTGRHPGQTKRIAQVRALWAAAERSG